MQISDWVAKRKKKGTLAEIARRIVEQDRPYREAVRTLQQLVALESLIANSCDQQKTADAIGVSRWSISRIIAPLNMADVRRMERAIKEAK